MAAADWFDKLASTLLLSSSNCRQLCIKATLRCILLKRENHVFLHMKTYLLCCAALWKYTETLGENSYSEGQAGYLLSVSVCLPYCMCVCVCLPAGGQALMYPVQCTTEYCASPSLDGPRPFLSIKIRISQQLTKTVRNRGQTLDKRTNRDKRQAEYWGQTEDK